jgi:hypothetical protein
MSSKRISITRINIIAYNTVCITSCIILLMLGVKIIFDNLFVKGMLALVSSGIFCLLLLQKPSFKSWLQMIVVIVIAVLIIGELKKI